MPKHPNERKYCRRNRSREVPHVLEQEMPALLVRKIEWSQTRGSTLRVKPFAADADRPSSPKQLVATALPRGLQPR